MPKDLIEIKGFKELKQKIKRLPDKIKRREMLKIMGQLANPTVKAARGFTPIGTNQHTRDSGQPGNLRKSIGKRTGKRGTERINAVVYVGPKLKGKYKGWYAHFVAKGTVKLKGNDFMAKGFAATKGRLTKEAEIKTAKYFQKQINKLSNA